MDDERIKLHEALQGLFPTFTLYFRPPSDHILKYPCIVYDVFKHEADHANNTAYVRGTTFRVNILTRRPGYLSTNKVLTIPGTSHVTTYLESDIVHDVFDVANIKISFS